MAAATAAVAAAAGRVMTRHVDDQRLTVLKQASCSYLFKALSGQHKVDQHF